MMGLTLLTIWVMMITLTETICQISTLGGNSDLDGKEALGNEDIEDTEIEQDDENHDQSTP